ncbi:MAG: sigma-70 family RNA polymerase sigma factor [Phycisphaerales bacterium]
MGPCAPIRETAGQELDGLYRFAVARLGGKSHMAEDVVQQALLIAMAHASPPSEAERQRAWLRGVVQNVIRRQLRTRRRGRAAMLRLSSEREDGGRGGEEVDGREEGGERARLVRALFLAVTELSRADQDLFYAVYRAGRSHACVAEELGTTPKGVEARLYRMRSRLRKAMESSIEGAS